MNAHCEKIELGNGVATGIGKNVHHYQGWLAKERRKESKYLSNHWLAINSKTAFFLD